MASKVTEVVEEFEDFEVDDITDEDDVSFDDEEQGSGNRMATTQNFMGGEPEIVDGIVDLGVVEVIENDEARVVRVIDDIGPVYYGNDLIEFKKGRRYRVPTHIYEYLRKRSLLWES